MASASVSLALSFLAVESSRLNRVVVVVMILQIVLLALLVSAASVSCFLALVATAPHLVTLSASVGTASQPVTM